ncbi:MAG: hypothetical protein LLG06_05405 [Desulfobacteraceae bacterium]|nr:hypothetical protein [Desulfobacteraceae bacterium]
MKRKVFSGLLFILAILTFAAEFAIADSYTQRLNLTKPMMGSSRWGDKINSALDLIDTAYGNILSYAAGRPELFAASAVMNGTSGVDVTLPKPVDAVNDYAVSVIYSSPSGANKGSLSITKAKSKVTVFSSNAGDVNPIEVLIYYASTISGFGAQVHRQWYVFPSSGDQTRADTVNGITALMIANGRNKADFILPGNASYNIMDPPLFVNDGTITFTASTKTISHPGATFVSRGFAPGMPIEVYGAAYNDYEFTIALVTEDAITVNESLRDETSTATVKVRWIIPSWIRLLPQNGALFNRADGKNLHIRGPFDPGDFQVFTGTGTTTFGPGAINHVPVTWCGAIGDGATDNTSAVKDCAKIAQQTITGGYDGATLMFPSGIYNVTTLKGCWGTGSIRIGGAGKSNTLVKSTTKQTVFDLSDLVTLRYLEIYDMTIEGGAVATDPAGSGHGIHIDVPGGNYAYSVEIRQVKFRGFTGHAFYAPDAFNIQLHHLDVDRCKDDAIFLRGGNTNFLNNVYVHGVADGRSAFRLESGYFVLMSCLGIDMVWDNPTNGKASWGHFGDATSGKYARGQIIGCDVEDFSDKGLYFESGSWAEIKSTNIYGRRDKTGLVGIY